MLVGLLVLAIATAVYLAALVGGRVAAGLPFGASARGVRAAIQPSGDATLALASARALGGVLGWYLASAALAASGWLLAGDVHADETSMRVAVAPNGPAARAGMRDGDRIVAVGDAPVASWDELRKIVAQHAGTPVPVDVDRAGERVVLTPTPDAATGRILVGPALTRAEIGAGAALARGLAFPAEVIAAVARGFVRVLAGAERAELAGPVGIVRETGRAASVGGAFRLVAAFGAYLLPVIALASALTALARGRRAKKLEAAGKSS